MKQLFSFLLALAVTQLAVAQSAEVTTESDGTKVVKGFISRQDLSTDPSFAWFAQNAKDFTPEKGALAAMKNNKDSIHILAFGGTWCSDTKYLLPKFYALADAAGLSPDRITLLGVDRSKKTIQHLSEAFQVNYVPTFIVLKNGHEVGRVVEYGKTGMFDKELGEIIAASAKK